MLDDDMLDMLTAALVERAQPSVAELSAFRSMVVDTRTADAPRIDRRWSSRVAVLVGTSVLLCGGTAYAVSGAAPREVRQVAHALGLPVEAPDLTDAKVALATLQGAVRENDLAAIRAALVKAEAAVATLSEDERRALDPRATDLLSVANRALAAQQQQAGQAPGDNSGGGQGTRHDEEQGGPDQQGDDTTIDATGGRREPVPTTSGDSGDQVTGVEESGFQQPGHRGDARPAPSDADLANRDSG